MTRSRGPAHGRGQRRVGALQRRARGGRRRARADFWAWAPARPVLAAVRGTAPRPKAQAAGSTQQRHADARRARRRIIVCRWSQSEIELLARASPACTSAVAGASSAVGDSADAQAWVTAARNDCRRPWGSASSSRATQQPPVVHALAHAMNAALGNAGRRCVYTDPVRRVRSIRCSRFASWCGDDRRAGRTLVILGGNPVYTAPADLQFGESNAQGPGSPCSSQPATRRDVGDFALADPRTHYLEGWSDAARSMAATIVQPLIMPLYRGRSPHEVLATLSDRPERGGYQIVREHSMVRERRSVRQGRWGRQGAQGVHRHRWHRALALSQMQTSRRFWRRTVHDGVMANTALPTRAIAPARDRRRVQRRAGSGQRLRDRISNSSRCYHLLVTVRSCSCWTARAGPASSRSVWPARLPGDRDGRERRDDRAHARAGRGAWRRGRGARVPVGGAAPAGLGGHVRRGVLRRQLARPRPGRSDPRRHWPRWAACWPTVACSR